MKSKNKITLLNMASTVVLQGLAFFSGPIFSNALGTSNYGIAAVYLTWVQISSIIFSLQAGSAIAVAQVDFPLEDQKKYQSSALSLATFSFMCFSTVVLFLSVLLSTRLGLRLNVLVIAFGLLQGWGMYCVTFMNSKFSYEFKAGKNFILSVSTSALTIVASLLLIKVYNPEDNYWGRIIGQSVIYTIIGLFLFIIMYRQGRTLYSREYWKYTLPITIPTIVHSLAHIVLNQSDKVMIQSLISNSDAGIYALAATFSAVINAIWHAFNNSWVPFYYEYTRQNQLKEMKTHAANYIELFTVITVGFILLSREVFHLYAGNSDFEIGTDYIPFLATGYYFVFLYSFPVNFEFYNKKTRIIAIGTISAAIMNIFLNFFMIKAIGTFGAMVATVISHVLLFIFHYLNAKRIEDMLFPFSMKDFFPGIFAIGVANFLYIFLQERWLIRWGIGTILGCYLMIKIIKRKEIF